MARLSSEKGAKLEDALVTIFQRDPSVNYTEALEQVIATYPELREDVSVRDLNYRVPKLRRAGRIPGGRRGGGRRSRSAATAPATHPVARAYQELDDAKQALADAQRRYDDAQQNLRSVLKENLPTELLESLRSEQ